MGETNGKYSFGKEYFMRTDSLAYREIARQTEAALLLATLNDIDPDHRALAAVLNAINDIAKTDPESAIRLQAAAARHALPSERD